jgi:predicted ATP-grasp superfamily ATP-dependent carboligase
MTNPKKILITDGSWIAAIACMQSLGRRGHHIYLVDTDPNIAAARSRYCSGQINPSADRQSDRYIEFLINLVKDGQYDLLIPISDICVCHCMKYQDEISRHIRIVMPQPETVAIAANKRKTYEFCMHQGIPIPRTYFSANLDEVMKLSEKVIYPCVVKLPFSFGREGVFVVKNKKELTELYRKNPFKEQWPVIQEFVDGTLYVVTAVAQAGRVVSGFMCIKPSEYTLGGTTAASYSVIDPALWERSKQIIRALRWTGAIGMDFIKTGDGSYLLLEINPRFSGSVNFAYRMGIDLPWDYFRLAFGERLDECPVLSYREGVSYRSVFPCEFLWCMAHRARWWKILKNWLNFRAVTNIYWDDPRLIWWQIRETRWECQAANRAAKTRDV